MPDHGVTVTIPVGPYPQNKQWLDEAIISVAEQTYPIDDILLIEDMAHVSSFYTFDRKLPIRIWSSPWRLGVGTAFNFGVALAKNDLVFLLGSDDRLLPTCIEQCIKCFNDQKKPYETYYAVPILYSDGREQKAPCNAAMVTKQLWDRCGGFPIESASGAPDAALLSIMAKHRDAGQYIVVGERPLYWYRVHDGTDTASRQPWQGVILQTRNLLTELWRPPAWGK